MLATAGFMDAGEAAICTSKKVLAGHQHEEFIM